MSPLEQLLQAKSLERKGLAGLSWDHLRQKMVAWGHFKKSLESRVSAGFQLFCKS